MHSADLSFESENGPGNGNVPADVSIYDRERAETDETACEDLAAWEQEETGQGKNQRNNCVNAAFRFFVIYKLQERVLKGVFKP